MKFYVYCLASKRCLLVLSLSCLTDFAVSQTTNTSLFTFADYNPTIPVSTNKVFTTGITLVSINANQSVFNESAFTNASTDFYSTAFTGFMSVSVLSSTANAENQSGVSFDIVYQVTYNYTTFSSQVTDDASVTSKIGSLSVVKSGLESTGGLSTLYDVSSNTSTFSFTGSQVCTATSCSDSYVICEESSLGLTPKCRSTCFSTFVCENGAVCVHRTPALSPNCNCVASSSVWYLGGRCEYKVEVWMIVVFLLGFVSVICLIILIACICCRRKPKASKSLSTVDQKPKEQETAAPVSIPSTMRSGVKRDANEPEGYMIESDTLPLSVSPPVTSAALVTVQESSSESGESSTAPGYYEDPATQNDAEPVVVIASQSGPPASPDPDEPRDQTSSSSESEVESIHSTAVISGVASPSTMSGNGDQNRRYNSLQFPNIQDRNSEVDRRYQTLNIVSAWDRGTQTNTRINIELPDSILMNKI